MNSLLIHKIVATMFLALFLCFGFVQTMVYAQFATINDRSLQLGNNIPGQTATYRAAFTAPGIPLLGSLKFEFCSNSPLPTEPCIAPAGYSVAGAVLATQTGETGFSIHPSTTANVLVLARVPAPSTGLPAVYELNNVINAAGEGTQYARYSTYVSDDGTGVAVDRGGIAYNLNNGFGVTTEVPPYLDFCSGNSIPTVDCSGATGNYVQLGDFSPDRATSGQTQLVVATNAGNGYNISVSGNTLQSGTNAIPALTSPTVSAPGNNQFGINLRANSNPAGGQEPTGPGSGFPEGDYAIINKYTFRPGDIIASKNSVEDYRKYTVMYLVNISRNQPPGIYAGTFSYNALGNF